MHKTLKHYFGYDTFRPLQEEIISHVMEGHDALVIIPTGGGKSMCYQLPALLMNGLTIVISPLIALMKDQVDSLKANGIAAGYLNSSQDDYQRQEMLQKIKNKELKLLYLSPESLQTFELVRGLTDISLIAIDEAHCISGWGHDFRPAYTQLKSLRQICPGVPLIALTATADKTTRFDILQQLAIPDAKVFLSSFDRPNISLTVRPGQKRVEQIGAILSTKPGESGILYCLSRGSTEKLAEKLQAMGFEAEAYHAGLPHDKRAKVQENFLMDRTQIICATVAFGMGIDKSNVRWIIHYNLPKNIEGYYQEIGRAGRDGVASDTILFYSYADVIQLTKFANDAGNRDVQIAKLERMKQYAESLTCRRKILLHYFGESSTQNCGNCDVCKHPPVMFDGTIIAQKVLSTVYKLGQSEPMSTVIDVLRGSKNAYITGKGYHQLSTHGLGSKKSLQDRQWYIIQLLNLGFLEMNFTHRDALILTETAKHVLFEGQQVQLAKPNQDHISLKSPSASKTTKTTGFSLLDQLKGLRASLSLSFDLPGHTILSDATLQHIEQVQPTTMKVLESIQGMSDSKRAAYGKQVLQVVQAYQTLSGTRASKPTGMTTGSTFMQTYDLLQQGKSPKEIAKTRDLGLGTIYNHIARLYSSGKDIEISTYISQEKVELVAQAMQVVQHQGKLKPLYDYIGGAVSYDELRLGISVVEKG